MAEENSTSDSDCNSNLELRLSCDSSEYDYPSDSESVELEDPDTDDVSLGLRPYQFEPCFCTDEAPTPSAEPANGKPGKSDRLGSNAWCWCGKCSIMEKRGECLCCAEVKEMAPLLADLPDCKCITEHPGFKPVCLDIYVLNTAYSQYRQQYRKNIQDSNNLYRYTAYRQLVRFVWGFLGKEIRVVLPACAVLKIRETFPSADSKYIGYIEPQ